MHGFLLPEIGLDPRSVLTPRDFRPGAVLVTELERAVETARLTLVVLSPAFGLSHWSAFAELLATHDSLMRDSGRLIPLLLEPYDLPLRLDFAGPAGLHRAVAMGRPRWPACGDLLQRGTPPPNGCPARTRGWSPSARRTPACSSGATRRATTSAAGCGSRTSCSSWDPRAQGSPPWCRRASCPGWRTTGRWLVQTLRPDAGALDWLTGTFGDGEAPASADHLRGPVDALLRTAPGAERLLLFFDQAETIFLLPSKQDRARFLALLDRLRRVDRCVVVLAMRADFYADLMTSVLWPLGRGERVEIAPLRGAALREAITRPAAGAGVYLEPVLAERLLRDAGEEPGALSLVQETMVLLWERRTRRLLTVSAYEDLGGQDGRAAAQRAGRGPGHPGGRRAR